MTVLKHSGLRGACAIAVCMLILADDAENTTRRALVEAGVMPALVVLLRNKKDHSLMERKHAVLAISVFASSGIQFKEEMLAAGAVEVLLPLLPTPLGPSPAGQPVGITREEVPLLDFAALAFFYLFSDDFKVAKVAAVRAGVVKPLVSILSIDGIGIRIMENCVRALGALVAESSDGKSRGQEEEEFNAAKYSEAMESAGLVPHLIEYIGVTAEHLRTHSVMTLQLLAEAKTSILQTLKESNETKSRLEDIGANPKANDLEKCSAKTLLELCTTCTPSTVDVTSK